MTVSSWEPVTPGPGGYDPNKRYVRASDKHGHHAQIKVSIPIPIAAAIGRLVQSGHIPEYEMSQDVIRDAVVHHVNRLYREIGDGYLEQAVSMYTIYHDALERQHRRSMFSDMMDNIENNVNAYLNSGRLNDLRDYLEGLYTNRNAIDEEFREEFTAYVERRVKNLNISLGW